MKNILFILTILFISIDAFAQKTDVRVEIFDLKEEVKKLQLENIKLSSDLISSNSKYENRILDLGVKLENLQFEFNVLKKLVEQYRNVGVNENSTSSGVKGSTVEGNSTEQSESKPKSQSSSQCSATTQKGTRCLRSARSNGLCWQHGG
jgi:hypothetical protein